MQSKVGFPSSHHLKSYVAPKSCLKFAALSCQRMLAFLLRLHVSETIGDILVILKSFCRACRVGIQTALMIRSRLFLIGEFPVNSTSQLIRSKAVFFSKIRLTWLGLHFVLKGRWVSKISYFV